MGKKLLTGKQEANEVVNLKMVSDMRKPGQLLNRGINRGFNRLNSTWCRFHITEKSQ